MIVTRDEALIAVIATLLDEIGERSTRLCEALARADRVDPDEIARRLDVQRDLNRRWRAGVDDALKQLLETPADRPLDFTVDPIRLHSDRLQ